MRKPRTNATTMKSLGGALCSEDDACFSSTHAKAARAVDSTLAAFSPLPCKKNNTTMGSEELERVDRAYTFVSRPAIFSVPFVTSPILQFDLLARLDYDPESRRDVFVCQQKTTRDSDPVTVLPLLPSALTYSSPFTKQTLFPFCYSQ